MALIHWSAHSLSAYDLDPIFHGSLNLSGALAVFCEQKDHNSTRQEGCLHYIFICLHKMYVAVVPIRSASAMSILTAGFSGEIRKKNISTFQLKKKKCLKKLWPTNLNICPK